MKKVIVNLDTLIELRKKHNFSISHVSEVVGYKTPTGYWLVEKGERKVNTQILYKLSKLYGVSMEELLVVEE